MNDYTYQSLALGFAAISFFMILADSISDSQAQGLEITEFQRWIAVSAVFLLLAIIFIGGGKLYALIEFSLKG